MEECRADEYIIGEIDFSDIEVTENIIEEYKDDTYVIGEIDFSDIPVTEKYCMALGRCKILVFGNEDQIPYFHIVSDDKFNVLGYNRNFETAICIFEPLYSSCSIYEDSLSEEQCARLNEWMSMNYKSSITDNTNISNWKMMAYIWELANDYEYIPDNYNQPDYNNIEDGSEYVEVATIGEIDFSDIEVDDSEYFHLGLCKIRVISLEESKVPHFHIISNMKYNINGDIRRFNSCICIFEDKYLDYGKYQDKLSKEQCIRLNEILKQKVAYTNMDSTHWQGIISCWFFSYGNEYLIDSEQPDYRYLENIKRKGE